MTVAASKRKQRNDAKEAVDEEEIADAPWGKVRVSADLYYAVKRKRDQDNAMASLKGAYDGIVDSGLIEDDDPEHMERVLPEFHIDKENPRLELTLERLA